MRIMYQYKRIQSENLRYCQTGLLMKQVLANKDASPFLQHFVVVIVVVVVVIVIMAVVVIFVMVVWMHVNLHFFLLFTLLFVEIGKILNYKLKNASLTNKGTEG